MSTNNFAWDYNEKSDILHIRKAHTKTKASAELGDFSVDFDKNKDIVGIEITNASEFLNQLDISKEDLSNIVTAELVIDNKTEMNIIILKLNLPKEVQRIIPIPAPVLAQAAV